MEWLGAQLAKQTKGQWESPELVQGKAWTINLSRNNRRILNSVLVDGSRNTNLTKPTYDIAALVKEGIVEYSEGLQLLLDAAARCNYPESNVRQMLRSAMRKSDLTPATEYYQEKSISTSQPWQLALAFALSWNWTGRTAQTDRNVFLACTERARLDNRDVFRCSQREIAELAACARETAKKALYRLRGDIKDTKTPKLLTYVCRDINSGASMYSFSEFLDSPSVTSPLSSLVVCGGLTMEGLKPNTESEKDLFGRQKVAWRVWRHLCKQSEPSKSAVARATGLHWSSVSRALDWLLQLGMVTYGEAENRYFGEHFTDEALGEIAKSIGVYGRSEKRRLHHQLEREKRANVMLARARSGWSKR
jgi:DNA-binding transcriptional ArsR family regulator